MRVSLFGWIVEKRGAVKFQYNAQHDTGNFKRHKRFSIMIQFYQSPVCIHQPSLIKNQGRDMTVAI